MRASDLSPRPEPARRLLAAMALAATTTTTVACTEKGGEDTAPHTGETGEPASTDTSPCGAWTGYDVRGAEWSYAWVSGSISGLGTTTLLDVDTTGGAASTRTVLAYEDVDYTYTITVATNYVCDAEGLWVGTQSTDWVTVTGDYTSTDWLLTTFDPPWLALQRDAEEGSTWVGNTHRSVQGSAVASSEADLTYSMSAALDTVTVPAGSFDALRVDVSGDLGLTSWYAAGVGLVKTGDLQLNARTP